MMVSFSWNQWLGAITGFSTMKARKRQARLPRIEGLEDRALLTANLPVAVNDAYTVNANTTLTAQSVLTNDTDADGDTIDEALVNSQPTHGTLTMSSNGTFTYTPSNGFSGTDSFTYTARDSAHGENSASAAVVTITVNSTSNGAPTANNASFSTPVNTQLTATLTGTDPDGDSLIYHTVTSGEHGALSLNSFNGEFTYTPFTGFQGTDTFTFVVNDGVSDSAPATVTITVGNGQSGNTAPVAIARSLTTPIGTTLNGTLTGNDVDGDSLTFAAGGTAPNHGDLTLNSNGTFSYTPDAGFSGNDEFTFIVNDGTVNSAEATVSIAVGGSANNHAPVATSASVSTTSGTTLHGTLTATDADNDPLSFSVGSTLPTHGAISISSNGAFTYVPNAGFSGTDTFTFRANDGTVNSGEGTITITVGTSGNATPVANAATYNTAAGTPFTGILTGTDADGDTLTFLAATSPAHGTVSVGSTGAFTYTPNSGFTGDDTFTFRVNDGTINSAAATVTIHVGTGTNTAPVAHAMTINTGVNTTFNGTLNGTDADGDSLSYTAGTNAADHGTVTINPNGTFTYVPANGFTGNDAFSYQVNDGSAISTEATVTIHVGGTNSPPTADAVTVSTNAGTAFTGTLSGSDVDGDPLLFQIGAATPANGTVTISANGSFTYTPDDGFTGDDFFSFHVSDGTLTSADALVTIHVGTSGSNTPPTANSKIISTNVNTTFNGALTGTDPDGDSLTFSAGSITASHGTVTIGSDGTLTYVPAIGYQGDDLFSFKVNDGTANSTEALVMVHVLPTGGGNHAPTVVNGSGDAAAGVLFSDSLSPLGTDTDGDQLTFTALTQPTHGTLSLNPDGTFAYTADAGFTGNDSFTFRASDGVLISNVATYTISIDETSDDFTLNLSSSSGTIATSKRSATPLAPGAALTNIDPSAEFANAVISADITSGADRRDKLVVIDGTSSTGQVDVRGKRVFFNGSEVARISGGRHGDQLRVEFSSNATQNAVTAVLQKVAVRTAKGASRNTRTVEIKVSAGGTTSTASIDANVA